ncbi:hypothetical protein [Streptomyces sp. VRA16 Mangrove soil]|uniref:hypothetical protein n=1 Tax=Streptomyces sp. VRA16 Mangrove soil TaxID=2817434 RepID=UPI001A9CC15F|nr:hypothetical protein [Streptomyces sp. VRA16 Mangrove soil]MBO1330084.1 hypothetical protein [Streptomyces sp. VRA16 Mangrove soil]
MSEGNGAAGARRTHLLFQPDVAKLLTEDYAWVTQVDGRQFARILDQMRSTNNEAMAMRALHAFALRRSVDDLVDLTDGFDARDAVMIMATAALARPVSEAAELAMLQREREAGRQSAPITASLVHDVACQRTAFDVAVFVRVVHVQYPELADRTVGVFAGSGSGRTNLDKVLLHTALLDEKCRLQADRLLELTLHVVAVDTPGGAEEQGEEIADLAGAFLHLSPHGQVLETWAQSQLSAPDARQVDHARKLIARLIARRGSGHDALAAHIGRTAQPRDVVKLCALLTREELSPAKCALLRRHAAGNTDVQGLAKLVSLWHRDPVLTASTRELLTDIVTVPTGVDGAPRSLDVLAQLCDWLNEEEGGDDTCAALLCHIAAVQVRGRSGSELAELLNRIKRSRERTRAAHEVGRQLAVVVMGPQGDRQWFVDCLRVLRHGRHAEAVDAACRELSDPSPELTADALLVAEVAGQLHMVGLEKAAWTLLERFLENEQLVQPPDVLAVVDGILAIPLPDAELLLRATVGRWSDVRHRDATVDALRTAGRHEPADWIVKSLR